MKTIHDPRYGSLIDYLCRARQKAGLSQEQVAHGLGWRRSMLSNIETRERRLDVLETHLLCRAYGVSFATVGQLLNGSPTTSR